MAIAEPVKILLVDDQPGKLLSYEAILSPLGEDLIKTNSAREALSELLRHDIAVVLVDVSMPEMDGYQTIHAIRQKQRFGRLPIIALTAKAMKGDREKCLEAGASDYLAKPVNTEQLLSALRLWLHR